MRIITGTTKPTQAQRLFVFINITSPDLRRNESREHQTFFKLSFKQPLPSVIQRRFKSRNLIWETEMTYNKRN